MAKVIRREDETVDQLIKRFSKKFLEEGTLKDIREKEYYKSKGQKRREKKKESERNIWIQKKKAERYYRY